MNGPFRLAVQYLAYNKFKTLILIACIFLTLLLPIAIKLLLTQFNQKILARANSTPVVIGAKGSRLDLTLHALYFQTQPPAPLPFAEVQRIADTDLAQAIPIQSKFTAHKFPLVGTTVDYFDFRGLQFQNGSAFAMLGECVLGSEVASELHLDVGDQLLSDRESVIDLAGLYPLKMKIAGVLVSSQTADDKVVFVDLKTAWVIQGLGHGHQDLAQETDEEKIMSRDDKKIVASDAVLPYTEITPENMDSFHFHGDENQFPISAIIALPRDLKSRTLLEGQYDVGTSNLQYVRPSVVIEQLMNMIFRIKLFFDANAILIAISTLLLMGLIVMLSLRLRQREMETMFKIGCSRGTIAMLQIWEMSIVFLVAGLLVGLAAWAIWACAGNLVERLLLAF